MKNIVSITLLSILTFSCIQSPEENSLGGYVDDEEYSNEFTENVKTIEFESNSVAKDTAFIDFSNYLLDLLSEHNLTEFSTQFHPEKGCTFVPYSFMVEEDLNFSTTIFQNQLKVNETLHWGMHDGNGEPINLTINNYFKQFVYDVDFKNETTEIHLNDDLAFSNTLNNISEFYPTADFIEFYFEGTTQYEGLDWSSVIFYIEQVESTYYLVAVVHNQWTI